jgi:DNA (cytosine-5)-methyltransferase 1
VNSKRSNDLGDYVQLASWASPQARDVKGSRTGEALYSDRKGRPLNEQAANLPGSVEGIGSAAPLNGFWRSADWLFCRDGRWRPVEPGSFPLAHGAPARVLRLRGYGDAINVYAAKEFIEASLEARHGLIQRM